MSGQIDSRYERQISLSEIGIEGQRKLEESSVLVIGAGGLGGPTLQYLAAAGVGRIGVMDGDTVSASNLNRQILYGVRDLGHSKALRAAERLRQINDKIQVDAISEMLTGENAAETVGGYDALALCLDSFDARKLANRVCVRAGIPFIEAGVQGFHGMVMTVVPGETPCYECVFGSASPAEAPSPILGAMAGWVGCAEALAVIRLLLDIPDPSRGALLFFDGAKMTTELAHAARNPECVVCGTVNEEAID